MNRQLIMIFLIISVVLSIFCFPEQKVKPVITIGTAVSSDGISIRYEERGEGQPALVFIHGWCCDRTYWEKQLPHFAQKYKVIAIDLPGHGESGLKRKAWTMSAFGEDLVAVVKKLGLKQVVLIGHSMGGVVILVAAPKIPDRVAGLVAVDEFFNLEEKRTQEEIEILLAPFHANFSEAVVNWVRTVFTPKSDPKLVERIVADMSDCPSDVGLGAASGDDGMLQFESNMDNRLIRALREVKAPLVFINSDSQPTKVEVNRRYLPTFNAKIVSGVGHFVMMEDPETFNRLLEEAIQEFVRTSPSK